MNHTYRCVYKCNICINISGSNAKKEQMVKSLYTKQERWKLERIMAAAFITDKIGYNYKLNQILLKGYNFDININTYTNNMTSVIRNVFRKIEEFVDKHCQCKFHPLSLKEFYLLRSPLIQARQWLYPDELQTFFKFVKLTYNLSGELAIIPEKANKLYGQILLTLQKQRKIDVGHLKDNTLKSARKNNVKCSSYRMFTGRMSSSP